MSSSFQETLHLEEKVILMTADRHSLTGYFLSESILVFILFSVCFPAAYSAVFSEQTLVSVVHRLHHLIFPVLLLTCIHFNH